jgi:hypothetical protein
MKNLFSFSEFVNELQAPKVQYTNLTGNDSTGIVVVMFFDSSTINNNKKPLWDKVIKIIESSDCTFVDYGVSQTLCEMICYPQALDPTEAIKKIQKGLSALKNQFTASDVYFNES